MHNDSNLGINEELSPDLDWMLQSGQASNTILAGALVDEYYTPLYRLAISLLDDPEEAAWASLHTLILTVMEAYRFQSGRLRGGAGVQVGLYRIALEVVRRGLRRVRRRRFLKATLPFLRQPQDFGASQPETALDAALWLAVDSLKERERLAILLRYAHVWTVEQVAEAMRSSAAQTATRLEAAYSQITASLRKEGFRREDLPEEDLELALQRSLLARWPAPYPSEEELDELKAEIVRQTSQQGRRAKGLTYAKEILLVAGVIGLVAGLVWKSGMLTPEQALKQPGRLVSATLTPAPTPTPALIFNYLVRPGDTLAAIAGRLGTSPEKLTEFNDLDEAELVPNQVLKIYFERPPWKTNVITPVQPASSLSSGIRVNGKDLPAQMQALRTFLANSQGRQKDLWLDAQYFYYGYQGYVGPAISYHYQAWFSSDGRRIELAGAPAGPAEAAWLIAGGLAFRFNRLNPSDVWVQTEEDAAYSALNILVDPFQSEWFQHTGTLEVKGFEQVIGRRAVEAEWLNFQSNSKDAPPRRMRLWIDEQTGIILRLQQYGGSQLQTLISELRVNSLSIDMGLARPENFDPYVVGRMDFLSAINGIPLPTPQAGDDKPAAGHERLRRVNAPPGFDPSTSLLTFQYPADYKPSQGSAQNGQKLPVELFGDGYYLGSTALADPWKTACDRSPDGRRVAFLDPVPYSMQNGQQGVDRLHWFELSNPEDIQTLPVESQVYALAFSPDNRRIAVVGYQPDATDSVIHLIDLERNLIYELDLFLTYAESLVWSPDGRFLTMVAAEKPSPNGWSSWKVLVVHVETGAVTYRETVDDPHAQTLPDDWPAADWPGRDWGIEFPDFRYGLSGCVTP